MLDPLFETFAVAVIDIVGEDETDVLCDTETLNVADVVLDAESEFVTETDRQFDFVSESVDEWHVETVGDDVWLNVDEWQVETVGDDVWLNDPE